MPPLHLKPATFPDLIGLQVIVQESHGTECAKQVFHAVSEIPERLPAGFGSAETREANLLYLGNRIREAYAARLRDAVYREPYLAPDGTGQKDSVRRTISIKLSYRAISLTRR